MKSRYMRQPQNLEWLDNTNTGMKADRLLVLGLTSDMYMCRQTGDSQRSTHSMFMKRTHSPTHSHCRHWHKYSKNTCLHIIYIMHHQPGGIISTLWPQTKLEKGISPSSLSCMWLYWFCVLKIHIYRPSFIDSSWMWSKKQVFPYFLWEELVSPDSV